MKALALSFMSVTFVSLAFTIACGSKEDESEIAATSSYTYDDTASIINASCIDSGCHNAGSVNKGLTTLAEVKAMGASKMITRIKATDSTVMPQNDQSFKSTDNGKLLLDWLAGGADLK